MSLGFVLIVEINAVKYTGFYITDSGVVGNVQYSGHTGQATLSAMNGDTMECKFNYEGFRSSGKCLSASSDVYVSLQNKLRVGTFLYPRGNVQSNPPRGLTMKLFAHLRKSRSPL
jgi:hypothetical protein